MTSAPGPAFDITPVTIEEEMKRSYLDYAMSVIVARALPDVRDGLKPVHRRILYTMKENGYDWNRPLRKSARVVGDVMGKYHPHGGDPIYEAMVRMAQDFSMRLPLIQGQGNFGSMDGDPPAAMRYTEARLARSSTALLDDIDKDTVEFQANYDESAQEPVVLPARFPNLLVNGAGGIVVGMATNIPTHNLGEIIDACCALIDNREITIDRLIEIVPGPDFPTGGIILGRSGIREAYHFGRGSIVMRARTHVEEIRKDRAAIVVTEVPYQVNKARLQERLSELVRAKLIEGISDIRDESDREGVRVVIELKREAMPEVVLNQLYRFTALQTTFGANMLALNLGRPEMLNLKRVLEAFIAFREEVITRRTVHELRKARERAHLLVGLAIAVANIDAVIDLIRKAPDPATARERLMAVAWPAREVEALIGLIDEPGRAILSDGTYRLSEAQARGILDLRLQRLTGLERDKIGQELSGLAGEIKTHLEVLGSRAKLYEIMRREFMEVKEQFSTPRRTAIEDLEFEADIEDLIQREDMVVTVSHTGYIKRVPLSAYRAQRRGGRGRTGMATKEEDFVEQLFVANTHTPVLFFSSRGMVYELKVYRLPLGTPQARGKALVNLLPFEEGEGITTVMPLPEDESRWGELSVMFATERGNVRRNSLSDFTNIKANGKIAMKLDEGDRLVGVLPCSMEEHDVLLATRQGKAIRFPVADVRLFQGRTSTGVRGIALSEGDGVISMSMLRHIDAKPEEREEFLKWGEARRRGEEIPTGTLEMAPDRLRTLSLAQEFILTVASDGLGKRSSAFRYRITRRGGSGIGNMDISRNGGSTQAEVVAAFPVLDQDQIMLVTDGGRLIRLPVAGIRIAGRTTRGVTLFRVDADERIVSVTRLPEVAEQTGNGAGEVPDGLAPEIEEGEGHTDD
ncbi:MAG TPA: DNA gyrase subunit A [Alphaproteobacteria bacterium]|nr:DNA gyrase subunit A [Alphaproteobacteria bacterium]